MVTHLLVTHGDRHLGLTTVSAVRTHTIVLILLILIIILYRHLPLCFNVDFCSLPNCDANSKQNLRNRHRVNWAKVNQINLVNYRQKFHMYLSDNFNMTSECFDCSDSKCNDVKHMAQIELLYMSLVKSLQTASDESLLSSHTGHSEKFKVVPGWTDYVQDSHVAAREAFLTWRTAGKPKQGPIFECMKRTKSLFKYALRHCRCSEAQVRADSIAASMSTNNYYDFWKKVKTTQQFNILNPTEIDGISGDENISHLWAQHYEAIFANKEYCKTELDEISSSFKNINTNDNMSVSQGEIHVAIKNLSNGKSPGLDNLSGEHLKHVSEYLLIPLSLLFTAMLTHGIMPVEMMKTCILPILKSKSKSVNDKLNYMYRPICLSNILSKVFENILYNRLEDYLYTTSNQFGFKKNVGTEMCVFALKEVIRHYHTQGSHIFVCYLDATAAFDRISYSVLFKKLIKRSVPLYIVRILYFWYFNQLVCVRWNQTLSYTFRVTNGVRQGGILSPLLFNVYMNDLSLSLNKFAIGCIIQNTIINHFMYADDIVLVSPSAKGLQKLVNESLKYGNEHNILYNKSKTVCMLFKSSKYKWIGNMPSIKLGDMPISFTDEHTYLGHVISNNLTDDSDILRHVRSLYCKANTLLKKFSQCSEQVKCFLFKMFCSNMYCSSLWCVFKKSTMKKLTVAYNNAFRIFLGLPRFCSASHMFVTRHVDNFDALIRKCIHSLLSRLQNSENEYIYCIYKSDISYKSKLFEKFKNLLYLHDDNDCF